jgi:hypothetical protein
VVSFFNLFAPGAALLLSLLPGAALLLMGSAMAAAMLLVSSGPPSAVGCRLAGRLLMGSAAALLLVGSTAGPLQRRVFSLRSCLHTVRFLRVNAHCGFAQCASDLSENQAPAWTPDAVTDTLMDLAQQEENPFPLHDILPNCQENLGSHEHGRRCDLVPQVYVVAGACPCFFPMAASEQDSIWGRTHWNLCLYQSELSQTIDDSFGVLPITITNVEIPISETYLATEIRGLLQNQWRYTPECHGAERRTGLPDCSRSAFYANKQDGGRKSWQNGEWNPLDDFLCNCIPRCVFNIGTI